MSEATHAPRPRLQTHIVSTYELVSSYAALSANSGSHASSPASASASLPPVPSLGELAKLQQELVSVRDDLANRKAQLRSEDDKARNYAKSVSKAKGKDKDKERASQQPSSQKHPNHQKQQQQQSQADGVNLKAINKMSRDQMRSSSADLSDAEVTVKRKKDPNKKRKRRPEIPLDSEDEYSDAPTPPNQIQSSLDSNQTDYSQQQQIKSRKTMPPPASAHAVAPPNAAAAPPLSRANSLSDISSAATPAAAAASATAKAHQQQSQRQDSPAQGSGLKVKLNGFKKEKSETPAPVTTAPSPPKRQPVPVGSAEDFSLPKKSLIPPPPPPDPPVPLPQRQVDVMGDFSKSKPGQQVPYNTFISFVEPYTRAFGDDDIAYLCQKSDDLTPFLIPSLGKYYLDAWMEADPNKDKSNIGVPPPQLQRFKTADLKEDKLSTEQVFAGPLGERLLSALAPSSLCNLQIEHSQALSTSSPNPSNGQEDGTSAADSSGESKAATGGADESQQESSTAMALDSSQPLNDAQAEAGPSSNSSSTPPSTTQPDGIEMEARLRRELRFLGVFPQNDPSGSIRSREGEVQWALRADDDISASLRACQRQLSEQINLNECRKARLATAVRARMARQEFEGLREMLDKQIEAGWQKRQKSAKKAAAANNSSTQAKPTTTLRGAAAAAAAAASTPGRAGSEDPAHGRGSGKATLPEQLLGSLDKRARLADGFRPLFDAEPGRFHGIPPKTIHGDDPAQGAVPQEVEDMARAREESVEQGQSEHGLHAMPDSVQIPASIVIERP